MNAANARTGPLVSIMMPIHRAQSTLGFAVASVLAQTHQNWELLAVTHQAAPESDWLGRLCDCRIRVLRVDSSATRGASRQRALSEVRGEFLTFLDADDWMFPTRLEHQLRALTESPHLALVGNGIIVEGRDAKPIGLRRHPTPTGIERRAPDSLRRSPVLNAASMIRCSQIRGESYDSRLHFGEDNVFIGQVLRGKQFRFDAKPLYVYRMEHSFSMVGLRQALYSRLMRESQSATNSAERLRSIASWSTRRLGYELMNTIAGPRFIIRQRCRPIPDDGRASYFSAQRTIEDMFASLPTAK